MKKYALFIGMILGASSGTVSAAYIHEKHVGETIVCDSPDHPGSPFNENRFVLALIKHAGYHRDGGWLEAYYDVGPNFTFVFTQGGSTYEALIKRDGIDSVRLEDRTSGFKGTALLMNGKTVELLNCVYRKTTHAPHSVYRCPKQN